MRRWGVAVAGAVLLSLWAVPGQQPDQQRYAALIEQEHFLRARGQVESALRNNPRDRYALIAKSKVEMAFNHLDAAVDAAQAAATVDDTSAPAHAQLACAVGWRIASSSVSLFQKIKAAWWFKKEVDRALQLDPDNVEALTYLSEYYWYLPGIAGGSRKRGEELADKIVTLDPAKGYGLKANYAGDEADKANRSAAVEAVWRQAVAARPSSYDAHVGLGSAYFLDGAGDKLGLAEAEANRAIALDGGRVGGYRLLAAIYAKANRWSDLDAVIRRARDAVPDDLSPQFQAARRILIGKKDGQWARAEEYMRGYLAAPVEGGEPSVAVGHWMLGLVLEKEGLKAEAVQEVQTAVNLDSSLEGAKRDLRRME
jgi:hypothetical protein